MQTGPNATTFVYLAQLLPVEGHTTGHGIASATGKIGGLEDLSREPQVHSAA